MRNLKFGPEAVNELAGKTHPLAATLYMPIHGSGEPPAVSEDSSRLNSLIHRTKQRLEAYPQASLNPGLRELSELVGSVDFWKSRSGRSLAFFVEPAGVTLVEMPFEITEHIYVDTTFIVGPLLAQLIDDENYFALVLSQKQPRLFKGNRVGLQKQRVEAMPGSLETALNIDEYQEQQQFHSGEGHRRTMFHGHGGGKDNRQVEVDNYLRLVRDAVRPVLNGNQQQVVLVGTEKTVAGFRHVYTDRRMAERFVEGNYDEALPETIHAKTWPIVERSLTSAKESSMNWLKRLLATEPGRVLLDPAKIRAAALAGQVQTLFLTITAKTRDSIKDGMSSQWLERFYRGRKGKALSQALVESWKHRGEIVLSDSLPEDAQAAAILRY